MARTIQRSVLQHLRSVNGRARSLKWVAGKVFAVDVPTRAQTVSVRRVLGVLACEPYCIVEQQPPLKKGGARWRICGYVLPRSLRPKGPRLKDPPAPKYIPTGLPTKRDDDPKQRELFPDRS